MYRILAGAFLGEKEKNSSAKPPPPLSRHALRKKRNRIQKFPFHFTLPFPNQSWEKRVREDGERADFMVRSGWLKVIICPASQLSIFAPGHICESMLHLERDDLVLRTALIEAGDIFPCTVRYMDRPDVRGRLPGELFGVFSPFGTGEVVEERKEQILDDLRGFVYEPLLPRGWWLQGWKFTVVS